MARAHAAAIVEDAWNRRITRVLAERGWKTKIVPYTGYGTVGYVRILGRILMSRDPLRPAGADATATARELRAAEDELRGWRAFVTAPAMNEPLSITVGDQVLEARTDRSGLFDVIVRGHGLAPGWHGVRVSSPGARGVEAAVLVVGAAQTFGIISDIDDTVLATYLPRPMVAAWNTFVREEHTRRPVPGMATMYRELLAEHPGAPIVYLSTGAWNTAPSLTRFMRRNGFPMGPMLLTDWGPTQSGWFRSGREHKVASLHRLARDLPHIRWLLVGDDGQHDASIYSDFAEQRPDVVRAIAIRELTHTEQVLTHAIPVASEELAPRRRDPAAVPMCRAGDGLGLLRLVRLVLRRRLAPTGDVSAAAAIPAVAAAPGPTTTVSAATTTPGSAAVTPRPRAGVPGTPATDHDDKRTVDEEPMDGAAVDDRQRHGGGTENIPEDGGGIVDVPLGDEGTDDPPPKDAPAGGGTGHIPGDWRAAIGLPPGSDDA